MMRLKNASKILTKIMRVRNNPFYIAFRKVGVKELMTFKSNEM